MEKGQWEIKQFDNTQVVILCTEKNGRKQLIAIVNIGELYPNGKANARLIAAAPDLLEACKAIVNELGNFQNIIQYDSFTKVIRAISKAERKK